jgi:hypothetical protein
MPRVQMMVGMTLGEERPHLLPPHSELVPRGLWRPPCLGGLDISHMCLIYDIFLHLAFCKWFSEGSTPLESMLCYVCGQIMLG